MMKRTALLLALLTSACMVRTSSAPPPRTARNDPPPPPPRDHRHDHRDHRDHDHQPPPPPDRPPPPMRAAYIEGTVTDGSTGKPLGRASLDYTGPVVGTAQADENGYFKTPELPKGEYNIRVRREKFETMHKKAHIIDGPQRVDIVMKKL